MTVDAVTVFEVATQSQDSERVRSFRCLQVVDQWICLHGHAAKGEDLNAIGGTNRLPLRHTSMMFGGLKRRTSTQGAQNYLNL